MIRVKKEMSIATLIPDLPQWTVMVNIFASEIGQAREYTPSGAAETRRERQRLMEYLPQSVDELPARRMADSFVTAVIPLKDQWDIRERYVTLEGNVRIGRVLEDMDIFSVYCTFRHIQNPRSAGKKNPYSVVTALVDSIHVANGKMRNDEDIRLSGHVTYAGRSSIETSLVVDQKDETGEYQKVFDAVFLMVARDPMNTGGALVNTLIGDTDEEKRFLRLGIERQAVRKAQELDSLSRKPPTEEERHLIHTMFIQQLEGGGEGQALAGGSFGLGKGIPTRGGEIRMDATGLKTVFICHPQYRNRYNKIFGGFIMRQACELAFTNTFLYSKHRPRLVNIDDIIFRRPVDIGSILRYTSHVGYVEKNYIHCPVRAEVINPASGECKLTNVFQFTFRVDDAPADVPPLIFNTYREAMVFLESRRHFKKMMNQFFPAST
ncbi:acyl-coenzyme A thioesterase 9, mitochondrial isoform X2 [Folsomia candida]|uniref:acyl-coenzyme A thioesterase 9, mitochondrial isoform X2 n=1 Tax=Folsomia candida TaxID=158441 RepID=UPI000B8FB037|nr:acyl-coenzyme A thioesterase 9, mitochondrial isoform X2 [Folsomia candida]